MASPVAKTVDTDGELLVARNQNRLSLVMYNNGSATVFLGDSTVTTSNGIPLFPGSYWKEEYRSGQFYNNEYYGIVSTGTCDIRVWDRERTPDDA